MAGGWTVLCGAGGECAGNVATAEALFDYLLDDEGAFVTAHKPHMKKELGIVSVGFNTIELLAVRDKATVQRFTTGSTVGVRRLIELINQDDHYSLGELNALLRSHALDVSDVLPIWARRGQRRY